MMEFNPDGVLNLRNAIIERMAKDYIYEKKFLMKHPNNIEHQAELYFITKCFLSQEFEDLDIKCSGSYIVKNLDKMVDEDIKPIRKRTQVGSYKNGKKD